MHHEKYSGPHGKREGVKRVKYNFSSVNTNQVGQSMSRERNEHSVESEVEGIRKGYIYIYIYIGVDRTRTHVYKFMTLSPKDY